MRPCAEGTGVERATAMLLDDGVGDGLPVVPPTEARCTAMLEHRRDADAVLGVVPPLFGELTASTAAFCCVLAGCRPGALPVVLAAAQACLDPALNLLGAATTTGTAAVTLVVHGPAAPRLGLSSGTNLLGPGPHANGVVGRALSLTLATAGGVVPGVTTMATTGQPGRYTLCLAEAPDAPYPTLAARRGLAPDDDAVTVLAVGGTAEVLPRDDLTAPDDVLVPLADALAGAALAAGRPDRMAEGEQWLVLPPEVARRAAAHAPAAEALSHELAERGAHALGARAGTHHPVAAPGAVVPLVAGGAGVKMLHLPGWIGGSRSVTRRVAAPPPP